MNIKQTADASGVSARNIRYYEQAGLLAPARNPENDYRIYTDADVRTLKLIRVLRTLDMPVDDIRAVLPQIGMNNTMILRLCKGGHSLLEP